MKLVALNQICQSWNLTCCTVKVANTVPLHSFQTNMPNIGNHKGKQVVASNMKWNTKRLRMNVILSNIQ